jgi:hypothetical protein
MRRSIPLAIGLALVAAACTRSASTNGSASPSVEPTTTTGTPSPDPTTTPDATSTPTPDASPRPIPPAWAEPVEEDLDPADLSDERLVPPGATLTDRATLPEGGGLPDQVVVAYVLGADPFAAEHGVAVWERFPQAPTWSVVLAFVNEPSDGVLGIGFQTGDLTGDLHDDVLSFEEMGGTGACGRWRVLASSAAGTEVILEERTCDTEMWIAGSALQRREAIYGPNDPHCCPRAFRTSTLEWDGERFEVTAVVREPAGT